MKRLNDRRGRAVLLASCALGAICSLALGAASDEPPAVGVVADFRPLSRSMTFSRPPQGQSVAVRIGTVVVAGDRVVLDKTDESITVQLANGELTRFAGPGNFRVPNGRPLGRLAAVFRSLPRLFEDERGLSGTAASRSVEDCGMFGFEPAPITVPAMPADTRIVAGKRALLLAWKGGCPPFTVTLRSGAAMLSQRDSIDEWEVLLKELSLSPGRYTVKVSDAGNRHWEGSFSAQPQSAPIPEDIASDSSPLGRTAQAICLAGQQNEGNWRLESANRLQPLRRDGDLLATSISRQLLWGGALGATE